MSLYSVKQNELVKINKVKIADEKIKHHLSNIGINDGCKIKVLKKNSNGLIVEVQGAKLALSMDIVEGLLV